MSERAQSSGHEWPEIPSYLTEPIVFRDKNLGLAMVAGYEGKQWVFKVNSGNWMTVRPVGPDDPMFIVDALNHLPREPLASEAAQPQEVPAPDKLHKIMRIISAGETDSGEFNGDTEYAIAEIRKVLAAAQEVPVPSDEVRDVYEAVIADIQGVWSPETCVATDEIIKGIRKFAASRGHAMQAGSGSGAAQEVPAEQRKLSEIAVHFRNWADDLEKEGKHEFSQYIRAAEVFVRAELSEELVNRANQDCNERMDAAAQEVPAEQRDLRKGIEEFIEQLYTLETAYHARAVPQVAEIYKDIRVELRLLLAAQPASADRASAELEAQLNEATMAEHRSHIEFENELYATLVDPVAEGSIKEAEMRKQLLESARWYRQHVYDLEKQVNELIPRERLLLEELEGLAEQWTIQHRWKDSGSCANELLAFIATQRGK